MLNDVRVIIYVQHVQHGRERRTPFKLEKDHDEKELAANYWRVVR